MCEIISLILRNIRLKPYTYKIKIYSYRMTTIISSCARTVRSANIYCDKKKRTRISKIANTIVFVSSARLHSRLQIITLNQYVSDKICLYNLTPEYI